ncbi:hypothetical protein PQR64_35775 [Paraburkholderia phytofirmans]|uniref:hypothetical protein n=1 Tax=Paraburkholderia phytofirmans TaxID=261302 RepID=UPI0038B828D4
MNTKAILKKVDSKEASTLEQLEAKAQCVRASLATALVKGDPTTALREFLVESEAEIAAERPRHAAEQHRIAAERATNHADQMKSAAVQKFEAQHPGAVGLINEANERRRALVESFRV